MGGLPKVLLDWSKVSLDTIEYTLTHVYLSNIAFISEDYGTVFLAFCLRLSLALHVQV